MKLAYLLSEYPTLGHTYLLREVTGLRARGWDVQVISIRKPSAELFAPSSVEIKEFRSTRHVLGSGPAEFLFAHLATLFTRPAKWLKGFGTAWRYGRSRPRRAVSSLAYFSEAILAGRWLRAAGFTHVHSVYCTTIGLIAAQVFDLELSLTLHGPEEFVDPEGFGIGEKVAASLFASAISYYGKSQIMLWSVPADWQKLEITPLGIDSTGWNPASFRENPEPFRLVSVGRLAPVKGFPLLFEAIASLTAQGRKVSLTIAGDGPERADLIKLARQLGIEMAITFAGWKTQEELRELYRESEACVLASFAEGIPVVFMEAMALGVPCIAPRITGIPELIRHGIDGLLFTPADVEDLASAIAELMDNTELRRRMAQSCPARVADKFNLAKNVDHLSAIFKRYLPQGGASSRDSL